MKKTKGFTLIELVIVILIVGILAAMTISAWSGKSITDSYCNEQAENRMERYKNLRAKSTEYNDKYDEFYDRCMDRMHYDD